MECDHWFLPEVAGTAEAREVERIAARLLEGLGAEPARSGLIAANQPGASSHAVQDVILPVATALGFTSEKRGLFEGGITGLRPDFHLGLGEGNGILLEVERGKTTTNNMDLLDFWKCHICMHARHLFLFVPRELRHSETSGVKREFETVRRRLSQFFDPRNRTNVRGLFLFGY